MTTIWRAAISEGFWTRKSAEWGPRHLSTTDEVRSALLSGRIKGSAGPW